MPLSTKTTEIIISLLILGMLTLAILLFACNIYFYIFKPAQNDCDCDSEMVGYIPLIQSITPLKISPTTTPSENFNSTS